MCQKLSDADLVELTEEGIAYAEQRMRQRQSSSGQSGLDTSKSGNGITSSQSLTENPDGTVVIAEVIFNEYVHVLNRCALNRAYSSLARLMLSELCTCTESLVASRVQLHMSELLTSDCGKTFGRHTAVQRCARCARVRKLRIIAAST